MFDFKKVPLPDYSRTEDTVNSISHALGVPFSIFCLIMLLSKLGSEAGFMQKFAVAIYCVGMFILYVGSAYYHGLKPGLNKQIARVLDHSNIFIMIAGTLTAFYLLGVINYNKVLAVTQLILSWLLSFVGIFLTFMNQEKFKKIQMVMYMLIGWTALIGFKSIYDSSEAGKSAIIISLIGGLAYSIGAIFYGIGKKHRYIHAVFHVFILAGTVLQFIGIYKYMI